MAFAAETLAAAVEHVESYEESRKRALALMKENTAFGGGSQNRETNCNER